jgi:hypothetical protein
MRDRSTGRCFSRLAALVLLAGCGGRIASESTDSGASPGVATGVGFADSAPPASSPTSSPTTGVEPPPPPPPESAQPPPSTPVTVTEDAGCSSNLLTFEAIDPTFAACWACAARGCMSLLTGCAADCTCSETIMKALICSDGSGSATSCFVSTLQSQDPLVADVTSCLSQTSGECNCDGSDADASSPPEATDAGSDTSAACNPGGGGGSTGGGQCSSSAGETCGSTSYQVVCACPQGTCVCFGPSSTPQVVNYSGCPYCPGLGPESSSADTTQLQMLDLCGFPH